MDCMDDDPTWRGIISDMDIELSQRLYNEVSAILPFSLLAEDLKNAPCTSEGFRNMVRSQSAHLLRKKGPRAGKDQAQKSGEEDESLVATDPISD